MGRAAEVGAPSSSKDKQVSYPSDLHRLVWLRLLAEHATLRLALRSTDAG